MALALMGENGAAETSMRQLAAALEMNVATLYHYFPSKEALIRAVIEERGYVEGLATPLPVSTSGSPAERLRRLVRFLGQAAVAEETVWRLILGQAVHSDPVSVATASQLADELETALMRWLPELLPDVALDVPATARVLRSQLLSLLLDVLLRPDDRAAVIRRRAADIATVIFA